MTREEAIEVIKQDIPCEYDTDLIEALEMAIKALEQEPMPTMVYPQVDGITPTVVKAEQEPSGDLISREAVRKVISVLYGRELCEITYQINLLPSVNPQQKTGFWCGHDKNDVTQWNWWDINTCSICGSGGKYYNKFRYCPSCGARMERKDKG